MRAYFEDNKDKNQAYGFYLSPEDQLTLSADTVIAMAMEETGKVVSRCQGVVRNALTEEDAAEFCCGLGASKHIGSIEGETTFAIRCANVVCLGLSAKLNNVHDPAFAAADYTIKAVKTALLNSKEH